MIAFLPAVLLLVQIAVSVYVLELDLEEFSNNLLVIVNDVFTVLIIIVVVTETTTTGVLGSNRAIDFTESS